MLVTMIGGGILVGVLLALVAGSYWAEEVLWKGWKGFWSNWRLIFPGYREAAAQKDIAEKLKVYSDGQDQVIYAARERLEDAKALIRGQKKSLRKRATRIRASEAHVVERDGVIENLRFLLAVNKEKPAKKCLLDKRRFTVIGKP